MAEGTGCNIPPFAISFKFLSTPCPTDDCNNKNSKMSFIQEGGISLTCSLVLTTSKGQVTVVPAAPASLYVQQKVQL